MTPSPARRRRAPTENADAPAVDAHRANGSGHLLVVKPETLELLPLHAGTMTVGRGRGCDIVLSDRQGLSRVHCEFRVLPSGRHQVVDLRGKDGVLLNGLRIHTSVLAPFDRLTLGDYQLLFLDAQTDPQAVVELLGPHLTARDLSLHAPAPAASRSARG